MWFLLSLAAVLCWGGSDLFSKLASPNEDRFSHWRICMAVGAVMGVHATVELLTGAEFHLIDFWHYAPAIACYVLSMILGYVGLRYLMLSVSSPICNSSGAVACVLCLIFLREMPDWLSWIGIVLVTAGVIGLAFVEKKEEGAPGEVADAKYRNSFVALCFPVFYCLLDGAGTFADALLLDTGLVNEESGNIAYEYTWLAMGVFAAVYLLARRQKLFVKTSKFTLAGAVCETAGQFAYIYALGPTVGNPTVAAPLISTYCVFSMVLSRLVLKEKLTPKRVVVLVTVVLGILAMGIAEGLAEA